ncbi:MAG: acetyl-CoA C-acyltransferase, partial [Solirubrobacteraceae bacterium]
NSPGVNDGAGATVVASDEWASANGAQPIARIIAHAQVADDYPYLARTPAAASKKALDKAGLSADDIDLWEINEAFASVTLNSIRVLGIDEDKVNVNGGAIALGHPIGASGARILGTLIHELRRRGGGKGCVAICSGGGQGDAVILEVFANGG